MDVREKLIELLCNLPTPEFVIGTRRAGKKLITAGFIADHLIANGVTVQENVEISDELLKQLKNAPITICKEEPSIELVQEWIPVEDRLPEEKVNCIVHYQHAYCDNDGYWAIGVCFYDGDKFQINLAYKVTHWMPLPQPPEGDEMTNCKYITKNGRCGLKGSYAYQHGCFGEDRCRCREPMTNADRIRAMSDEELAKIINAFTAYFDECNRNLAYTDCHNCELCKLCGLGKEKAIDWLQQPFEGE